MWQKIKYDEFIQRVAKMELLDRFDDDAGRLIENVWGTEGIYTLRQCIDGEGTSHYFKWGG
jgi:hypothetical protein